MLSDNMTGLSINYVIHYKIKQIKSIPTTLYNTNINFNLSNISNILSHNTFIVKQNNER